MSSEQVHRENSTSLYFIKKRTILNLVKLEKKWKSARVMFPVLLSVPKQNRPNVNVCRWSSHLSPTHANPSLSIFFFSKSKIAHFGDPRCLFFHLNKMIWHLLISTSVAAAVSHEKVSRFFVHYSRTKDESCLLIEWFTFICISHFFTCGE